MVVGLADQQNRTPPGRRLLAQQVHREFEPIQNRRAFVPRLKIVDRRSRSIHIRCKVLHQGRRAIKAHHRNPVRNRPHHRAKQRAQVAVAPQLPRPSAARLHRNHQRQWLVARLLVQSKLLLHPIVGNFEVLSRQRKHRLSIARAHQRGNNNYVGLRAQLCRRGRRSLRGSNRAGQQHNGGNQPHRRPPGAECSYS